MATVAPHVTTTLWLYLRKGAYGNCFEGLLGATLPFSEPSSRAPAVDSSAILASEVPEKCARDVPPVAGAAPRVPRGGAEIDWRESSADDSDADAGDAWLGQRAGSGR